MENNVLDIVSIINNKDDFKNKSFLITGGTGFIGSYLIRTLIQLNKSYNLNIKINAIARSLDKVKAMDLYNGVNWRLIDMKKEIKLDEEVDYIIHTASPTDSKYFIEKPVEVINDTITWLNNITLFAKQKNVSGMVFLSSLEVYGNCNDDKYLKENEYYSIDCNNVRSSYSEGKKILECLCSSYAMEYNVPIKIVRLGQTFGPGIQKDDNRVFAQFARSVSEGRNIVLNTKGETKRSYCSIDDAVCGIFTTLFKGNSGESYNLVSDDSYISIYELAMLFAKDNNVNVVIEEKECKQFLSTIKFGLDTTKIKQIGFKSVKSIKSVIPEFIEYFKHI